MIFSNETIKNETTRRTALQLALAGGALASSGLFAQAAMAAVKPVTPTTINRQWFLKSRPNGPITMDNYEYRETPLGNINLKEGEILVRHLIFGMAPATRVAMSGGSGLTLGMPTGQVVRGGGVSEVVMSKNSRFPVGALTMGVSGWEDYTIANGEKLTQGPLPKGADPIDLMSILGGNAQTAYIGMTKIGEPKPGEIVVVSGASGSVGSVACQIARIMGAKVIGIAGGAAKCETLVKDYKVYGTIDYKGENVSAKLKQLAPNGVNVYYDNVGGVIMQDVVEQMAHHGRVVLCGTVSSYNSANPAPGPRDMLGIVTKEIKLQGFELPSYMHERDKTVAALKKWKDEGQLVGKVDIRQGFKNLPATLELLFTGDKEGTLLLKSDA
jgi:NADPH-dependent curcumin reductase CurA